MCAVESRNVHQQVHPMHGLRTPNEGMIQRNLKIWADVAVPKDFGVGVDFWPCSDGDFLTGRPLSVIR